MPNPSPRPTPRLGDAYPGLIDTGLPNNTPPPVVVSHGGDESANEITAAIHGLTDYIKAMDTRTAAVEKAIRQPRPARSTAAEQTRATAWRTAGTVAIVALLCTALVIGLYVYLDAQGLADTSWVGR